MFHYFCEYCPISGQMFYFKPWNLKFLPRWHNILILIFVLNVKCQIYFPSLTFDSLISALIWDKILPLFLHYEAEENFYEKLISLVIIYSYYFYRNSFKILIYTNIANEKLQQFIREINRYWDICNIMACTSS